MRTIFRLAREGDGTSGPFGTKKLAVWLNENGYRSRNGARFGTGTVHGILTRLAYTGKREFNAVGKDGERNPETEIITYEVPQIIDSATFDAVQSMMVARQPKIRGPRLDAAPSLLGGLIRCDCTPSYALSTATGTSRRGKVYTYYKCIRSVKQGHTCSGEAGPCCNRRIPRPLAEQLVTDALLEHLLTPKRVTEILIGLKSRRDERNASADRRIQDLGREIADADQRLSRLYKAIEEGTIDGSDPTLKERISNLRETRDRATEALDYARRNAAASLTVDPVAVDTFIRMIRERLTSGDTGARKAWIGAVVDAVIVGDGKIRIIGSNDNIAAAVGGTPKPKATRVRNSVQEWCRGRDSNPRPHHYE